MRRRSGCCWKHGVACISNKVGFDGGVLGAPMEAWEWSASIMGLVVVWVLQ